jgi:hypothetical protein
VASVLQILVACSRYGGPCQLSCRLGESAHSDEMRGKTIDASRVIDSFFGMTTSSYFILRQNIIARLPKVCMTVGERA